MVSPRRWTGDEHQSGARIVLDATFSEVSRLTEDASENFNCHEFSVRENGQRSLHFFSMINNSDVSAMDWTGTGIAPVVYDCFRQVNLTSKVEDFVWCPQDHGVQLTEATIQTPGQMGKPGDPWDFL